MEKKAQQLKQLEGFHKGGLLTVAWPKEADRTEPEAESGFNL